MIFAMAVWYIYGYVYSRNESQSGECKCNTEDKCNWLGSGGMPVCRLHCVVCREWTRTWESGWLIS